MRKEYGKALQQIFTERMQANFPAWRATPAPKTHYWGGERAFVLDDSATAWLVVILAPNLKDHDAFDIELGWSLHGRVPELGMRPSAEDPNSADAATRDEYLCRLSHLVGDQRYHDGWVIDHRTLSTDPDEILSALTERQTKITAADAHAAVSPFVDDVMRMLDEYGVPYLEGRLASLESDAPDTR